MEEEKAPVAVVSRPVAVPVDHGARKTSLVPVQRIGMQHDLLPVEEETNEVPESEEAVQVAAPMTPAKVVVSPPPLIRLSPATISLRRRVVSESDTPPSPAVQKAPPASDKLRSPGHTAATVTIAMLNAPENRQEANQLRHMTTITATTGPRHLKELQRNIRQTSQTDIFLNSFLNRRALATPDRRSHHGASGEVANANAAGAESAQRRGVREGSWEPEPKQYHTWHPASPHARPRHTPKGSHASGLAKHEASAHREREENSIAKLEHPSSSHTAWTSRLLNKLHLRPSVTDQGVHVRLNSHSALVV